MIPAAPYTDEWLTPPFVLDALGGWRSFDLDPCTPIVQPWPTARDRFTVIENGLLRTWHGRVYLNPPYQAAVIGKWLGRMSAHGRGVALIFARTDTDPFFRHVWNAASAMLFLRGRVQFHRVDGSASRKDGRAPSVLCAYGQDDAERLAFCGLEGKFVPLQLPRFVALAAFEISWRAIVDGVMREQRGPVKLDDLYRAIANHPRARRNRHWQAQVRQKLQEGSYRNIAPGLWEIA